MRKYSVLIISFLLCLTIATGCKKNGSYSDTEAYNQAVSYYKAEDYEKSFRLFSELAERGVPKAQGYLGVFYSYGLGVSKDQKKAVYWYKKSAQSDVPTSMAALASMYKRGLGVGRDCEKSVYWYKKSSEQRNTIALYDLSQMYKLGVCVSVDRDKGHKYLLRGALVNDEYGLLCKALVLYEGIKTKIDYIASRLLFERISDDYNNNIAFFYMYRFYYFGRGVERNIPKSLELLNKASELGLPIADYTLAVEYYKGRHVEKNYSKVLCYAMKSEKEYSGSAYILGVLYEKGFGVPVDIEKAKKWYRQAIDMGDLEANKRLSALQ